MNRHARQFGFRAGWLPDHFSFTAPSPTGIYPLSLHDALPIWSRRARPSAITSSFCVRWSAVSCYTVNRSEEHTSELQSRFDLVCRLLLEKKKSHGSTARLRPILLSYPSERRRDIWARPTRQ